MRKEVSSVLGRLRLGCWGHPEVVSCGRGCLMSTLEPGGQAFSGGHCSQAFVLPRTHPCLQLSPLPLSSFLPSLRDAQELWDPVSLPEAPATLCTSPVIMILLNLFFSL